MEEGQDIVQRGAIAKVQKFRGGVGELQEVRGHEGG